MSAASHAEPAAEPRTTAAAGSPASELVPASSVAAMAATVPAAT